MLVNTIKPTITVYQKEFDPSFVDAWGQLILSSPSPFYYCRPNWFQAICEGLQHVPYVLAAHRDRHLCGGLPLAFVKSWLFGRFLVSLPYVNSAGATADDAETAAALIRRAAELSDQLKARHLELRHEIETADAQLNEQLTSKVHMRLRLPADSDTLWKQLKAKVRNQVRKGESNGLTLQWGREDLLSEFYDVFARNMRDLGTPVFGNRLFRALLAADERGSEFCVVRYQDQPVAAALLIHHDGVTEVPSASSLRQYNHTNANMFMYWNLLSRAVERKQEVFDFGRSTVESNTFKFKQQWGASAEPAVWQYYMRQGSAGDMRRDNKKFELFIRMWSRLPVSVTRWLGPSIVRGIP